MSTASLPAWCRLQELKDCVVVWDLWGGKVSSAQVFYCLGWLGAEHLAKLL